ncbi:MAG: protein kinase [Pirellulaceae bacterium]|nr:protein kinase [Pirellulaceae bacterium]
MTVIGPVRPSHETRLPATERLDIEQVAEEYLERRRHGEKPSVDEYARRYPELADEIRELFPTLAMLEDCASAGGKPTGSPPGDDWRLLSEPIGEYRIIREIGRGGMGVVYEAEHQTLRRRVALKLLPRDAAAHPSSLARFLREARAAGRMHHSNIVSVFEVGVHHDRHFYAMQYIHGQNLDAVIEELRQLRRLERTRQGLDATQPDQVASDPRGELGRTVAGDLLTGEFRQPREEDAAEPPVSTSSEFTKDGNSNEGYFQRVARVGLQVAEALDYAHRHGILHRDIKPSNLILDTSGTVWVTDFGLAKQEGDDFTHTGDVVGTLRYMAPERLQGRGDARSDLYSLGLTLYELITLRPALDSSDRAGLIRQIESDNPPPLRQLAPQVPRDLETIVLKTIEKSPAHRYRSAAELAEDLRLFLADRPILARRSLWAERVWRWCRRNPVPALLASCVGALLLLLAVGSLAFAVLATRQSQRLATETRRAIQAEEQAVLAKDEAVRRLYEARLGQARAGRWSARLGQHFETLASLRQAAEILPTLRLDAVVEEQQRQILRNEAIAALPLIDLRESRRWEIPDDAVTTVALPPDYSVYAISDQEGNLTVRQVADDVPLARLPGPGHRAWSLMFSPDGRYLAGKFHRGTPDPTPPMVRVWDWRANQLLIEESQELNRARMAFRGDGGELVLGMDYPEVRRYELPSGKIVHRHRGRSDPTDLCWDPTGTKIAVAYLGTGPVEILERGTDESQFIQVAPNVNAIAWSPDGTMLAMGTAQGRIHLVHDQAPHRAARRLEGHLSNVVQLCFNHGGDLLLSRSWDSTSRLWRVATGQQVLQFDAMLETMPLLGTGFRHDDRQLALASGKAAFGLRDVASGGPLRILSVAGNTPARSNVQFHPARPELLASSTADGVELWDAGMGCRVKVLAAPRAWSAVFSPDGSGLFSSSASGVQFWPLADASVPLDELQVGDPQTIVPANTERIDLAVHRRLLAVDCGFLDAKLYDLDDGNKVRGTFQHRHLDHVAISPDASWMVTATWKGRGVVVWDLEDGKLGRNLAPEVGSATPAFSPDGRWLAVSDGYAYYLWEVGTWRLVHRIERDHQDGWPGPVAFSRDGCLLAVPHTRYVAQLIDPQTGKTLGILETPGSSSLSGYAFSADNRYLAIADADNIQLWDLNAVQRELESLQIPWPAKRRHSTLHEVAGITSDDSRPNAGH